MIVIPIITINTHPYTSISYIISSKHHSELNDNIDAGMIKLKWEGSSRIKDIRFQNIIKLKHNTVDL